VVVAGCARGDTPAPDPDAGGTTMRPDPEGPCADEPWMSADASASDRARALVAAMDLDQKLAQVHGEIGDDDVLIPGIEGLCVPDLRVADDEAGTAVGTGSAGSAAATALPAPIALAATWDPVQAASFGDVL